MSKNSLFGHVLGICPSRGHIRSRTNMALDRGKVFEDLFKTFEECREPNWDGYGAQAVREETYDLAHQFLAALPLSTPAPSIGAEPDGHLTAEWHRSPERTLSVSISPNGHLHYATLLGTERICGTETFRARMPQVFVNLIARIEERDTESF